MSDFNSHLGLEIGASEGTIALQTRDEHLVAPDTIHFAVLTTMAEVAAAGAVGAPVVPASVNVNLLARAQAGRLEAKGLLVKRGRRLAVAEGEVRQGDRLVAKATVTFAVIGG
jgi:uncharacterized protein (TIGR00369 family)